MTEGKVKAGGLGLTQHTHKHVQRRFKAENPKSLNEAKAAWRR